VNPCKTLRDIEVGKCACIRNYKGECKKMRRRLLDLGLTPHTKVNIVQKAPLGDPILLQVGESNLSLSSSEAAHLEVDSLSES
jgi:Fe2+ transport system protein FeoA